jgi:hypothetical protein
MALEKFDRGYKRLPILELTYLLQLLATLPIEIMATSAAFALGHSVVHDLLVVCPFFELLLWLDREILASDQGLCVASCEHQ